MTASRSSEQGSPTSDAGGQLAALVDLQGRLTYASGPFLAAHGYAWEELAGQPYGILQDPAAVEAAEAGFWTTLAGGGDWQGLVRHRNRSGAAGWFEASLTPVLEEGSAVGSAVILSPPTDLQVQEAEALARGLQAGRGPGAVFRQPWVPSAWPALPDPGVGPGGDPPGRVRGHLPVQHPLFPKRL